MIRKEKFPIAEKKEPTAPGLPWRVLAVDAILMVIVLAAGFLYTRWQIGQIKKDKRLELRAIAELKASQVRHWRNEILDNGRFLRSSMNFNAKLIEKLNKRSVDFLKMQSTWMEAVRDFEGFGELRFLHLQVRPVWPVAEGSESPDPARAGDAQAVAATGDVSLSDLYFSKTLERINLSLRVPTFTFSASGQMLQAELLLSVDPNHFLFPLIQSWPTPSPSAETLLVRREGNAVVFLNDLRHRKDTALKLRIPLKAGELPATHAANGKVGFIAGKDYRGVAVLAFIQNIPDTSWSLIAKIDQVEVNRLVARQEWVMFVLVFSSFLLIILFTAYSWRRQQVGQLRRQIEADSALRHSEERYRQLVENLGEGMGISDKDEKFIFYNPAAEKIFGVAPGSLAGRNLKEFLPADERHLLEEQNRNRARGEKGVYELRIRRADGTERMLLVTAMPLKDSQGEVSGAFAIFRDISERKQDEEKIRKMLAEKELLLKEVHHRVKNNMLVIDSLLQIQAQRIRDKKTTAALQESRNRIRAMMIIYEKLYRTTDLTRIKLGEYFSELGRSLFAAYNIHPGRIDLVTAIDDMALDIDRVIPCGLIVNELVSNALKYAFPGDRKGYVKIEFRKIEADDGRGTACRAPEEETDAQHEKDTARLSPHGGRAPAKQDAQPLYALTVANDGAPPPDGFDITKSTGFGLQLVGMLAGQLDGTLQVHRGGWTEFQITFPKGKTKNGGAST